MPEPARRSASPRRHRSRSPSRSAAAHDSDDASTSEERRQRRARRRARREAREARHAAEKEERRARRRRDAAAAAEQPSRLPDARGFGANLFAAERAERARHEEREWAAKLGDLLEEDEWGCGLGAGEEYVPHRWGGMRAMEEEDYAEHMRRGMHRRKAGPAPNTGSAAGTSSSAHTSAGGSAKPSRPVRGPAPAPPSTGPSAQELALASAHEAYSARWTALLDASKSGALRHADIAWPVPPTGLGPPDLSIAALRTFLVSPLPAPHPEPAERLRTALRRFHPDRFFSAASWKRVEDEAEKKRIEEDVLRVAQGLSQLVAERRDP